MRPKRRPIGSARRSRQTPSRPDPPPSSEPLSRLSPYVPVVPRAAQRVTQKGGTAPRDEDATDADDLYADAQPPAPLQDRRVCACRCVATSWKSGGCAARAAGQLAADRRPGPRADGRRGLSLDSRVGLQRVVPGPVFGSARARHSEPSLRTGWRKPRPCTGTASACRTRWTACPGLTQTPIQPGRQLRLRLHPARCRHILVPLARRQPGADGPGPGRRADRRGTASRRRLIASCSGRSRTGG